MLRAPTAPQPELTSPRRSRKRRLALRAMSVALGVVVACATVELALWLFGIEPTRFATKRHLWSPSTPQGPFYACYPSNPHGEFSPVPKVSSGDWRLTTVALPPEELPLARLSETPWCVEFELSSLHLRDREFAPHPAPGVLRIACLGDSFVMGDGVPLEQTLSRQTERRLGAGYEVMNVGATGWNTRQELAAFLDLKPLVHFDRTILVFVPNDIDLTPELEARQTLTIDRMNVHDQVIAAHGARPWYVGHSRLLEFAAGTIEMARISRDTIQWYQDMYDPAHNQSNLERLGAMFRQFAEASPDQVALVLYPLLEGLDGDYPLTEAHRRVAELGRKAGLPVLDLAPAFAGQDASQLWVHPSDHHPGSAGHAIAAGAIVDWLRREHPAFLEPPSEARDAAVDHKLISPQPASLPE